MSIELKSVDTIVVNNQLSTVLDLHCDEHISNKLYNQFKTSDDKLVNFDYDFIQECKAIKEPFELLLSNNNASSIPDDIVIKIDFSSTVIIHIIDYFKGIWKINQFFTNFDVHTCSEIFKCSEFLKYDKLYKELYTEFTTNIEEDLVHLLGSKILTTGLIQSSDKYEYC